MGVTSYGPGYGDWVITNPGHWIYEGMGVSEGDSIPAIIGWEFHGTPAEIPGLEVVAGSCSRGSRSRGSLLMRRWCTRASVGTGCSTQVRYGGLRGCRTRRGIYRRGWRRNL